MMVINKRLDNILRTKLMMIVFWALSGIQIQAQLDGNSNESKYALDTLVRYGRLANGFTYYLRHNDQPEGEVEFHMVVKAGSGFEEDNQIGYAHLLEHLGAKSTKHFRDFHKYFRHSGRYSNAHTGLRWTYYHVTVPSKDKSVLDSALLSIKDRAADIVLEPGTIKVERQAVLGEMRTNNPYDRWVGHEIEQRVQGFRGFHAPERDEMWSSMKKIDTTALFQFYREWYRPDLQAAIIVGDIQVDSMEVKIKEMFSELSMPKSKHDAEKKIKAMQLASVNENQIVSVRDTVRSHLKAYILTNRENYHFAPKSVGDYRKMILKDLYDEIIKPRKLRLLETYHPPFSGFSTNYSSDQMAGGQLASTMTSVEFDADNGLPIKEKLVTALTERKRMHLGFTQAELKSAKKLVLENYKSHHLSNNFALAGRYLKHFVNGAPALSPIQEAVLVEKLLASTGLEEVQAFSDDYADLTKGTDIIFFTPPGQMPPRDEELEQWIELVQERPVAPMQPPTDVITSLISEVDVKRKDQPYRAHENMLGVSTITLDNGVKIVLKPTKSSSRIHKDRIGIFGFRRNRVPKQRDTDYVAAKVVPDIFRFMGAGAYSKFDIERFRRDYRMNLSWGLNHDIQFFKAESNTKELEELLSLLHLYMKKPVLDEDVFSAWKAHTLKDFEGKLIRHSSRFYLDEIEKLWYSEEPYLTSENLETYNDKKILSAYQKWYGDISDYTIIVTGDFEVDKVMAPLCDYFMDLPLAKRKRKKGHDLRYPLKPMKDTIRIKNSNQSNVRMYFPVVVPKDIKTQVSLDVVSKYFGKRAHARLREGCYAPVAGGQWMDEKNGIYAFWVEFDSELGNEDTLIQYALEEFRKVKEDGVDPQWMSTAISDMAHSYERQLNYYSYFDFWSEYLKKKMVLNEDLIPEVLEYKTLLEHFIDVEDVNEAARTYMQEDFYQHFIVLPENYSPAK